MKDTIKFLILFYLLEIYFNKCIPGGNCPIDHGQCINDICKCYHEYWSICPEESPILCPLYCTYRKFHRSLPFVLEFFLPSSGHFYIGKYIHGSIKVFLMICLIFYIFEKCIFNNKEKKKKDEFNLNNYKNNENVNNSNNNNNIKKRQSLDVIHEEDSSKEGEFESLDENKDNINHLNNSNKSNKSSNSNYKNVEIKDIYSSFNNNTVISENKNYYYFHIFIYLASICLNFLHITDLVCYAFAFYKDGKGVPLI